MVLEDVTELYVILFDFFFPDALLSTPIYPLGGLFFTLLLACSPCYLGTQLKCPWGEAVLRKTTPVAGSGRAC